MEIKFGYKEEGIKWDVLRSPVLDLSIWWLQKKNI